MRGSMFTCVARIKPFMLLAWLSVIAVINMSKHHNNKLHPSVDA